MTDTEWRVIVDAAWDRVPPSIKMWEALTHEQRAGVIGIFAANGIDLPIDWQVRVERICILCRHWELDGGHGAYSDVTPGSGAETCCGKGKWSLDISYGFDDGEYATKLLTARTCPDFTLSRVALENMPENEL